MKQTPTITQTYKNKSLYSIDSIKNFGKLEKETAQEGKTLPNPQTFALKFMQYVISSTKGLY